MITNKLPLGGRSPVFRRGKTLHPRLSASTAKNWTLSNSRVSFTFLKDGITGVRLYSWRESSFAAPIINRSKNLWSMGILTDYKVTGESSVHYGKYILYPSNKYFIEPSTLPVEVNGVRSFTFLWKNVPYDRKNTAFTCDVTVVASLDLLEDSLDMQVSVTANQAYRASELTFERSSVVQYLGFPSLAIKKDDSEEVNAGSFLTNSISFGYTYLNPFKYLRTPRYNQESYQYTNTAERCFPAGAVGSPSASLNKFNYGSPGLLTIPAVVYGNRDTKEGTLVYGLDRAGTNPKCVQFYVDDANIYIKMAHASDHAYDPYGVGGYTSSDPLRPYSINNVPTWSLRIHPYKSPTRWADWHGYELYRNTVVPKLESYGWIPSSFYDRYQSGLISKETAEMPMILNTFGFTTGDMSTVTEASNFYKDLYVRCINPNFTGSPKLLVHYQTAELNFDTNRRTNPADPAATYNGWEPWAGFGTGVDHIGPEAYKAPDYTGLNSNSTGAFAELIRQGHLPYAYNIYPFTISSGSVWTQLYSGIDLVGKSLRDEERTITNDDYRYWAYSGNPPGIFGLGFSACFLLDINKEKNKEIASTLGSYGMNAYHDTLGLYGRGCLSKGHTHYDPVSNATKVLTHPRANFSNYHNGKQVEWMTEWTEAAASGYASVWLTGGTPNAVLREEFKMAQSSEFPCDANLQNVPVSLLYEPLGPIFNAYTTSLTNPRSDRVYTTVDNIDDAGVEFLININGIEYVLCNVEPPNWLQRCPAFQLAFNDRSIQNEWQAVYSTNSASSFFKAEAPTGVGSYGQLFYSTTGNSVIQAQDWSAISLTQWPYSNRMCMWHVSNQYGFIAPSYSSIETDENVFFQSGVWSGYAENLITRMLRVQAYNPDFMYHGDITYPLDEYTVERSTEAFSARRLWRSQHANTLSISGVAPGDEKVPHFVRRHRNNGNVLIVAGNWSTGNATFQGTFDPASYGITNGYQVYSLDVNTINHGTKTLDSIIEAEQTFNIGVTLGQHEFKVYEIEVNQALLDNAVFADLRTDFSSLAYEYTVQDVVTDSLSVAYSYNSAALEEIENPQVGFKSAATQQILNNLPQWMKMRQDTTSRGWKLTNSWGMGLEKVIQNVENNTNNLSILTANTSPLSKLGYIDIDSQALLEPKEARNILFNSSFSIKDVSRTMMPSGWEKYDSRQSTYLSNRGNSVTCCSLVSSNGQIKVGQEVIVGNVMVNKLYASVYILCDAPTTDVTLHVSVEHTDATNQAIQAKISNRSSEWVRLVLPIDVNNQVYRINFSITADCDGPVSICAPQLQTDALTSWSKSNSDVLPYLDYTSPFNLVYAFSKEQNSKKIPIFPVLDEQAFIEVNVPTRIEKTSKPIKDLLEYSTSSYGRRVDQLNEVTRTEFSVVNSQIVERAISPTPFDIYGEYNIRDLRFYEELRYGTRLDSRFTLEPLATAVRKDILFVICKETFQNETKYVLKVIKADVPPNGQDYLESLIDFDLNLSFNKVFSIDTQVEEEVFSISFSDVDANYLIVTTTNNAKYYYKISFDYYYFNSTKNRLYLIESYPEADITVI